MNNLMDLTLEQLLFIASYVEHRDKDRAINESGALDGEPECSPETRMRRANEMLANPLVAGEIDRRLRVAAMAAAASANEVIDELRKIAFFDPRKLFDDNGNVLAVHELRGEEAAALAHMDVVSFEEGGTVTKIVPQAKLKALELLGKHHKLFTDKVEHNHRGSANFTLSWTLPEGDDGADLLPAEAD